MPGCCRPAVWLHVAARRAVAVALLLSVCHTAHNCSGLALTARCWSRVLSFMDPGSDVRVNDFLWQPPDLREWQNPPWHPHSIVTHGPRVGDKDTA